MQIITFLSAKGGVGKTTLTANCAHGLHRRGNRVLAIDLDPQNALRLHMGMDPSDDGGYVREGLGRNVLYSSQYGVYFAPFGNVHGDDIGSFEAFLEANPDWLRKSIAALSPLGFDYVVIDTPPGPNAFLQQALSVSNLALVVVMADAASYTTLPHAKRIVDSYVAGNPGFRDAFAIINQQPLNSRLGHHVRHAMTTDTDLPLAPVSLHRDPHVGHAVAYQEPVLQYAPNSMAALDFEYLIDWIVDQTQY